VMGTAGYMSPEQVRGLPANPASDTFSLGCILYEMVCGRRAFQAETGAQTMAAIIEKEPPPTGGPARLDEVVIRCLRKGPAWLGITADDRAELDVTYRSGLLTLVICIK